MDYESKKGKVLKEAKNVILTVFSAFLSGFALHVFVYKINCAPSGIDGIATMVQQLTGLNAGVVSLMINIPLLIAAFFVLNKKYVYYTVLHTIIASGVIYLLSAINFYQFVTETDKITVAVFS